MICSIMNGCGHMWYLPMLFWCFVMIWILLQPKMKEQYRVLILLVLYFCSFFYLPFRMNNALGFLLFFYVGFWCYKYCDKIKFWISAKCLIGLWLLFLVVFIIFRPLRDVLVVQSSYGMIQKLLVVSLNNACRLIYAFVGLIAFYCTAMWLTQNHELNSFIIRFSVACFGIYLFQQFILQLLYYKTNLSLIVGPYLLPWIGFVSALIVSFLISVILLKTKMGRFLIG